MNLAPLKILLVEDSPSDAELLRESLTQDRLERFEFTHAGSWAEAVKSLQHGHFDVLLLDLSLPDSTGPDTFLRARAESPHVPIVVLTGVQDDRISLEAVRHGIQDYLVKGQADGHQIARAIRYAIERKRAEELIQRQMKELYAANEDLTRFNRAAVGRELRMIELKKEINELCARAGQPPRYPLDFEKDQPGASM